MDVDRKLFDELQADCDRARKGVQTWAGMKIKTADQDSESHAGFVALQKENMNNLKKDEIEKKNQLDNLRQKLEEMKAELETCRSTALDYKEELHSLPAVLEDMKQDIVRKEQEIESQGAAYEEALKEKQYKTHELTKGVDYFKRNLGLEFQRVDDRLRLIFKHIDPRNPRKKFYFTIQVTDDDVYLVHDCNPEVPGLDDLLEELNETNDISSFVVTMRKEFKRLCQ